MREIELTKGKKAIVDDEDYELLKNHTWCATESTKAGHYYARAYINLRPVYMHRLIMQVSDRDIFVDHRNRNTLDNRRENLRICTRGQNRSNSKSTEFTRSNFRGVEKLSKSFSAHISVDGKRIHLGSFETDIEAAIAYNKAALQYKGEFATLNEIPETIR